MNWTMDGANTVRLGANVRVNNIRNLKGGMANDLFRFTTATSTHVIDGSLDGGGGFNTLEYVTVPNPFVTDLVGGTAPRIVGLVSNIHAVIPDQLPFNAPSFLSSHDGDLISHQLTANSTVGGVLNFGATGLPNGLSIDPESGLISGTIVDGALVGVTVSYQVTVTVSNGSNSRLRRFSWDVMGTTQPILSSIVGRYVFYNGSSFAIGGVETALDTGKVLAKEGTEPQVLSYDNLINTGRGINGLVFDIADLPGSLTPADFAFQMSPQLVFDQGLNPPSDWLAAPAPIGLTVATGTHSRVVIRWADNAIANRWLRVTIQANSNTGLAESETYYIGHLLGETTGAANGFFTVSFADIIPIRSAVGQSVGAESIYDIDKNGTVSFADISAMRGSVGAQLTVITIPAAASGEVMSASSAATLSDGKGGKARTLDTNWTTQNPVPAILRAGSNVGLQRTSHIRTSVDETGRLVDRIFAFNSLETNYRSSSTEPAVGELPKASETPKSWETQKTQKTQRSAAAKSLLAIVDHFFEQL